MNTFTFNFNTLTNLLLISLARVTFFSHPDQKNLKSECHCSIWYVLYTTLNWLKKRKTKFKQKKVNFLFLLWIFRHQNLIIEAIYNN